MPDERWNELFAGLRSDRDRAILALGISTGARASELLGVRCCDLDWGEQLVRVCRKGSGAEQWLPASLEAFVWIRLYLAGLDPLEPREPLWWTLRRRDHGDGLRRQPVNYEALRAVFKRVNVLLGTNYSMHDLRHTAALRMKGRGVASDATFGTSREHALPAAQRAALRRPRPAGAPCGYGDLGLHGPPGSDATMMRLMPLRGVHHGCVCWHCDASGCTRLHRAHHRRSR
jgi:integrase